MVDAYKFRLYEFRFLVINWKLACLMTKQREKKQKFMYNRTQFEYIE